MSKLKYANKEWLILHQEGDVDEYFSPTGEYQSTQLQRTVRFAGKTNKCDGGIEIEEGHNYSGSGPEAFGHCSKWPHLTLHFAFPEGRKDLRNKFSMELQTFIDKFITEHNLEKPK